MSERPSLVSVAAVSKVYRNGGDTPALQDVSFEIARQEFVALVGQSGCGKTTLLNLLGALDRPTRGSITLDGKDYRALSDDELARLRQERIGFVFQFHYLLGEFTVLENALMPLVVGQGTPTPGQRDYVAALLGRVGLTALLGRPARQLSGGQAQRVAIVRALANKPALILADEPTGNLDTDNGAAVFALMRELNQELGSAFILVTHDERLACQASRLIRMQDGKVVQDVPTNELPDFVCRAPAGHCAFQVPPAVSRA